MPKRIDQLTDEQRARMSPWAQEWIARGRDLSEPDWVAWEAGVRDCYRYAGIAWPGLVVRVPSPLVGALAAPIAAHLLAGPMVSDAVSGAKDGAVRDAVHGAVGGALDGAVHHAVRDAVRVALDGAVHHAVRVAVSDAVRDVVSVAVGGAVHVAMSDAVRVAVHGAVHGAVRDAVSGGWYQYLGGQWWCAWQSWSSYFRDVCHLDLPGDLWDRDRAYAAAQSAGWWWPHRRFVMVSERPRELHLERVRPDGWGSHRLHNATGPSIAWDGWALHHWHGLAVPADLIEGDGWSADRILREPNVEIRRAAIERRGWDRFVADAGMRLVSSCPDPANAPHTLDLYDIPAQVYGEPVRVVLMTNASPDRDGTRRRYGETVPAGIDDPLSAQAWAWDVPRDEYALMERAT